MSSLLRAPCTTRGASPVRFTALLLVPILLVLLGCYESPVPLPQAGERTGPSLLGTWEVSEGKQAGERLVVNTHVGNAYLVKHIKSDGTVEQYEAWQSVLSSDEHNFSIFSVRKLSSEEDKPFMFALATPYGDNRHWMLAFFGADAFEKKFHSSELLLAAFKNGLQKKELTELIIGGQKLERVRGGTH